MQRGHSEGEFEKDINQESEARGEFIRTYAQFVKKVWHNGDSNSNQLRKLKVTKK